MIVYGSSLSPFVRKVLAFAAEKGIEVELKPTGLGNKDPEFIEASPFGKMPGLRDGDFAISDSSRDRRLYGGGEARAEPHPDRARRRGRGRSGTTNMPTRSCSPAAARSSSTGSSRRASSASRATRRWPPRRSARSCRLCSTISRSVIPASGFLVEDRLTLADIAVASPFANLRHFNVAVDRGAPSQGAGLCRGDPRPAELRAAGSTREAAFLEKTAA